ncbi:hypothetical protein C0993_002687 [Termitomyces sp. T159_Od127]|nr:hypothetical protein C0993_002687 [Termitomyces sp. T159_Od127]
MGDPSSFGLVAALPPPGRPGPQNPTGPLWALSFPAIFSRRTLLIATGGTVVAVCSGYWYLNSGPAYPESARETRRAPPPWTPPGRAEMLASLKASAANFDEEFDLLIVGGGNGRKCRC